MSGVLGWMRADQQRRTGRFPFRRPTRPFRAWMRDDASALAEAESTRRASASVGAMAAPGAGAPGSVTRQRADVSAGLRDDREHCGGRDEVVTGARSHHPTTGDSSLSQYDARDRSLTRRNL